MNKRKYAFTFLVGSRFGNHNSKKHAFTLAEVLITLIVIGVVAAITVPTLHNDAADKKWNVARQKAQATIGEAFRLMTVNDEITDKFTTEEFVNKVLSKYLKLEKTCKKDNYSDCGFPSSVKTPSGVSVSLKPNEWKWTTLSHPKVLNDSGSRVSYLTLYGEKYDTNYFFRTLDGFSVSFFYNPYCASSSSDRNLISGVDNMQMSLDAICFMGVYDMNGKAKPNQVGKDIGFIGSFYNGYSVKSAAVLPHKTEPVVTNMSLINNDACRTGMNYCDNLDKEHNWTLPDINEYSLIFLNAKLASQDGTLSKYEEKNSNFYFFSRTPSIGYTTKYEHINFYKDYGGIRGPYTCSPNNHVYIRCVRSNTLK